MADENVKRIAFLNIKPRFGNEFGFFHFVSLHPFKNVHINKWTLDINNLTKLGTKNLLSLQRKYERLNDYIFVADYL